MSDNLPLNETLANQNLELVLNQAQELLQAFAASPDFREKMQLTFGDEINASTLREIWNDGKLGELPELEIISESELDGANGAFARETNTIYLSQQLVEEENVNRITSVFLEEYGHYVDSLLTPDEAPGDEGQLFTEVVRENALSSLDVVQLKAEDDTSIVWLNGKEIAVEQNQFSSNEETIIGFEADFNDKDKLTEPVEVAGNKVTFKVGPGTTPEEFQESSKPFIAKVGSPETGFDPRDDVGNSKIGNFFLTDDDVRNIANPDGTNNKFNYFIDFNKPVQSLSLDLLDFDKEGVTVTLKAFSDSGSNQVGEASFTNIPPPNGFTNLETLSISDPDAPISSAIVINGGNDGGTGIDNITFSNDVPDLTVKNIEVSQGIQTLSDHDPDAGFFQQGDVNLVEGKGTLVRAYIDPGNINQTLDKVTGHLKVQSEDGKTTFFNPISKKISLDPEGSQRDDVNSTLNFFVPGELSQGKPNFTVHLDPENRRPISDQPYDEINENNNFGSIEPQFQPRESLNITLVEVHYTHNNNDAEPETSRKLIENNFTQWNLPTANIDYTKSFINVDYSLANDNGWEKLLTDVSELSSFAPNSNTDIHVAVVPNINSISSRTDTIGLAKPGGNVAAVTEPYSYQNNFEVVSRGPANFVHEIGHNFGRLHVNTPNENPNNVDTNYPYQDGLIGESGVSLDNSNYSNQINVKEANIYHDVMSYAIPQWTSPYTYNAVFNAIGAPESTSSATASTLETTVSENQQQFLLSGTVNTANNAGQFQAGYVDSTISNSSSQQEQGDYQITLQNSDGETIQKRSFALDRSIQANGNSDPEAALVNWQQVLPFSENIAKIILSETDSNTTLATRTVSANAPQVALTSVPSNGKTISEPTTIEWQASDADGDTLSYVLQYSTDAGETWKALAVDRTENTYTLNPDLLAGTDQGKLRVLASDGVNTTSVESEGTFSVANKTPKASISTPQSDTLAISQSESLILQGNAFDLEQGNLSGDSLNWKSNLDGQLGTGRELVTSSLSAGEHTITLSAQDSQGKTSSDTTTVFVADEQTTALSIAAVDAVNPEGDSGTTPFTFEVTRFGNTADEITVDYKVFPGALPQVVNGKLSATADDFGGSLPSGSITLGEEVSSRTVTVNVTGDEIPEAETSGLGQSNNADVFGLSISNPSNDATIVTEQATGKILNDDPILSITPKTLEKQEGDSGTTTYTFTLTRSDDTSGETTVSYEVTGSGDNPANAEDFGGSFPSDTVTFADGEGQKDINVEVVGDSQPEPAETFDFNLDNSSDGATIIDGTATGTIVNDDLTETPPSLISIDIEENTKTVISSEKPNLLDELPPNTFPPNPPDSLTGPDQGLFTLETEPVSLPNPELPDSSIPFSLKFKNAPDFEQPEDDNGDNLYEVGLTFNSIGALTVIATLEVKVTVTDVNEAPAFEQAPFSFNLNPDQADEFSKTVTATDPEQDEVSFQITEGNDPDGNGTNAFAIDNEGTITVADAEELEGQEVFNLTVQASDGDLTSTANVEINVGASVTATLDIGGNGEVDQPDALLLLGFAFDDDGLMESVIEDANANSFTPNVDRNIEEVKSLIQNNETLVDLGGNGEVDQPDALLLLGSAFGDEGLMESVIEDANANSFTPNVDRNLEEVKDFIEANSP